MKKFLACVFVLMLGVGSAFAQDTGSTGQSGTTATAGKKTSKKKPGKKPGKKGGKKGKKSSGGTTTQPPK